MSDTDVPSPIDFHDPLQARAWIEDTAKRRPYRALFFAAFVEALRTSCSAPVDILELGSGPGHLAKQILQRCDVRRYVALDFSLAMHQLARPTVESHLDRIEFVHRDFRHEDWGAGLGLFEAVVTMQAAHETRHKRHLLRFFYSARQRLNPDGVLLYADHYAQAGDGKNPSLMASRQEQRDALEQAGFSKIEQLLDQGGMALYSAVNVSRKPPE